MLGKFADRRITHPSTEVPILTWWKGIYDYAFIAPHPLYRVPGFNGLEPFPGDDAIKSNGEAVSWSEIHRSVAPERTREEVYLAIWLLSVLGFAERANTELQKRIEAFCLRERLYLPDENGLPPILESQVGRFLAQFGLPSVKAWDQFQNNTADLALSDLDQRRPAIRWPHDGARRNIWALHLAEPGVFLTWEFESTEIIIGMTDRALSHAAPENFFEGWYADQNTYFDVHNAPDFLKRRIKA
jgi:hypothetical protein